MWRPIPERLRTLPVAVVVTDKSSGLAGRTEEGGGMDLLNVADDKCGEK